MVSPGWCCVASWMSSGSCCCEGRLGLRVSVKVEVDDGLLLKELEMLGLWIIGKVIVCR